MTGFASALGAGGPAAALASAWLPAGAWALLIWSLGGDGFDHATTGGLLDPLFSWLLPGASAATVAAVHGFVRKAAHATEYGVLAVLCIRALRQSGMGGWAPLCALALASLLAFADEGRQAQSVLRTGSGFDVGLDVAGASLAVALLLGLERRRGGAWFVAGNGVSSEGDDG